MANKVIAFNQEINYAPPLKDKVNNYLLSKNEIHPAMVLGFVKQELKNKVQSGGDGYTIDVNKSINGMVNWSRYSFNYAPIIYGDLTENNNSNNNSSNPAVCNNQNGGGCNCGSNSSSSTSSTSSISSEQQSGGGCGCNGNQNEVKPSSIYDLLQQSGGGKIKKMKVNQFDAIQQVGKGLVPLSMNNLVSLVLLIFLHHSIVDGNVENKKISKKIKKGGADLVSTIAPLGRGNLLILASLLLLHHFAVEKPNTKKVLKGGSNIYEQMNKILAPLGLKSGVSPILTELYEGFQVKKNESLNHLKTKKQNGGSILKSIIAPLGTNSFVATGVLLVMKKLLLDKDISKVKKGGSKKDFERLVNLLGPLSFNAFANENFVKEIFKLNKNNKKINKSLKL
jgi:hypothetical protein